jgi:hypothetical protein
VRTGTGLPRRVLQSESRPEIADRDAFARFNDLLRGSARALAALGHDPVAVAASPNRFDDALSYEWRALRCGIFFSEKESYGGKYDLDRDILTAPQEAKSAYEILKQLEKAGWRTLFATAFDVKWTDQSLAVVVQDGLTWLVFSSNNISYGEGDPVFAIWDEEPMSYFGEAKDRFDWAIQDQRPLVFLST